MSSPAFHAEIVAIVLQNLPSNSTPKSGLLLGILSYEVDTQKCSHTENLQNISIFKCRTG